MDRNDQAGAVAHALVLAGLQVGRQTTVAGTGIAATERLPGKIIVVVRMSVDQAQQPLVQHFVERGVRAEQRPLLRRNPEAEQQRGRSGQQARQRRMKQPIEAIERRKALGRVRLAVQQGHEIDPGQFRHEMCKPDEAAEHAVTIETVGEISVPRTAVMLRLSQ